MAFALGPSDALMAHCEWKDGGAQMSILVLWKNTPTPSMEFLGL